MGSEDIHAKDAFKILVTGVFKSAHMRHSGAVDENVYPGESENCGEYGFRLCRIGKIARVRGRVSSELGNLLDGFLRGFSVEVYDADGSAMLRKAESDCLTDTAGATCYERHFVVQTKTAQDVAPYSRPEKCWNGRSNVLFGESWCVNGKNICFII